MDAKLIAAQLWQEQYFRNSKRQYALFEFLLTNSLSDTPRQLDQYVIATEVLGRDQTFDSYSDSIVRSEISRLRKSLAIYNAQNNEYKFIIPKGRYNIEVKRRDKETLAALEPSSEADVKVNIHGSYFQFWPYITAFSVLFIAGLIYITLSFPKNDSYAADCSQALPNLGLTFETEGTRYDSYIGKIVRNSTEQYSNIKLVKNAEDCVGSYAPSYSLKLTINTFNQNHAVLIELIELKNNTSIFFKRLLDSTGQINNDFDIEIYKTSNEIFNPQGFITKHAASEKWNDQTLKKHYKCNLNYYDILDGHRTKSYDDIINCLSNAKNHKHVTLGSLGILAQLYFLNGYQNYKDQETANIAKDKNNEILAIIGDKWLDNVETVIAKTLSLSYNNGRPNLEVTSIETALSKYPYNWHVLTISAAHYGYKLGKWEKALVLDKTASQIIHYQDSFSYYIKCGYSLVQMEAKRTIKACQNFYTPHLVSSVLALNVSAYQNNNQDWIEKTEKNLVDLGYSDIEKRIKYIENLGYDSTLLQVMIEAWETSEQVNTSTNSP